MNSTDRARQRERLSALKQGAPYQLAIMLLSILVLLAMAVDLAMRPDPETRRLLAHFDFFVCIVFLGDFAVSLYTAPDRRRYFLKWGWLDLLSSIPQVDAFRWGRAARIFRVVRLLRAVRAAKTLGRWLVAKRGEGAVWASILLGVLTLFVASLAVLNFERGIEGSNIEGADDALWWAFVTITTVGYGDRYPVSPEGRFLAAMLMLIGVSIFGTLTAVFASWFMGAKEREREKELEGIRVQLSELVAIVEERLPARSVPSDPASRVVPGQKGSEHDSQSKPPGEFP